jgi:cysteine desulfurase
MDLVSIMAANNEIGVINPIAEIGRLCQAAGVPLLDLIPLVYGGGQEGGLRSGTENVGAIMALGRAAELAHTEMAQENERLLALRSFFLAELRKIVPGLIVNGSLENRLANNLNVGFPRIDSGSLLLSLNRIGVYVSAGSACSAGSREVSDVIKALGVNSESYGIIRFSFGLPTTQADLEYLLTYLPRILDNLYENTK